MAVSPIATYLISKVRMSKERGKPLFYGDEKDNRSWRAEPSTPTPTR